MPSPETDPKPAQTPESRDHEHPKESEKNVDRDGRERHPTEHTTQK